MKTPKGKRDSVSSKMNSKANLGQWPKRKTVKHLWQFILMAVVIALIGCDDGYEPKERTNPYDPENPAGRKVISVISLTTNGVSEYPSWSADETKIAYYNRSDTSLYIMDSTGKFAEKLPLAPDQLLFSTELKYQMDLDNGDFPEGLAQEFKDNKILLSQNVTVSVNERDKEWLIIDKDRGLTYTVRKNREQLNIFSNHLWEIGPRWSPTENKIAYIHSPNWDISVRDYPGTDSVQLTEDGGCNPGSLIWSRDGAKLAYIQNNVIKIMDADGDNKRELKPQESIEPIVTISDWSPDGGKLMVIAGKEPKAYILALSTNHVHLLPKEKEGLCWHAVWSTDGAKQLYVTFHSDRYELWIINADGNQAAILTKDIDPKANFIGFINWSQDESAVLFMGSEQFYARNRDIIMMRMELR
jgi:Tol biopolymer transport system component